MVKYQVLAGEIAKRGIKKRAIANRIGISDKALYNKMSGVTSFSWDEVRRICTEFFPDIPPDVLFAANDQQSA